MSQVFSGDSVNMGVITNLPATGETPAVTGNFLNPPFQNAKAILFANISLNVPTGATALTFRIRRNPNAENAIVVSSNPVTVTAGSVANFSLQCADVIPDGRPVQYSLSVAPTGASAAGSMLVANISAILISG